MKTILKSASMLTIDKENKYFDVISMKLLSTKFPKWGEIVLTGFSELPG